MSLSLIVPIAADKAEYAKTLPYVFNFADDGVSLCVKSVQGLDMEKFEHIYFVILSKFDAQYNLAELLQMQFRKLGMDKAKVIVLSRPTSSQAETVYQCIKAENIDGGIFVKDADSFFTCDFTANNGIAIFPLDQLDFVNPHNKSYVDVDDQFYITNIIEQKIISRYFNAGGYLFEDVNVFCEYFERLKHYQPLYMSHIVYAMLLDNISFRPFNVSNYQDWGTKQLYHHFITSHHE